MTHAIARVSQIALLAAALAAAGGGGTTVEAPQDTGYDPNDLTAQLDFWHELPGRSAVTNDEAFHGVILLFESKDEHGTYENRVAHLQELGWLPDDFDEPADLAVQRGTLSRILVRALDIETEPDPEPEEGPDDGEAVSGEDV